MRARPLLSLLFHADKALDLVQAAMELGVLERLDAGPVGLDALCAATGARPLRMYKFLDGLESLGLVVRDQPGDSLESATYMSREPLLPAAQSVLGERSIERDRSSYPWREVHGRLPSVLRGERSARFAWPPESSEDVAAFEASMAAGCLPAAEALRAHAGEVFGEGLRTRWLDVGCGDGTLAAHLLAGMPQVEADVFNLPAAAPLVARRAGDARLEGRLGFVGGDFLAGALPAGYDVLSFVRVLHDWPAETARDLLRKAYAALPGGGRVVVCEEFRDADRLALQFFWTYFLIGVDACVSRLREAQWYCDALAEAGFAAPRVLPGPFDLVVARKNP
ncbi:MAG: methyltransferase [Polyangiaceae bacterium]